MLSFSAIHILQFLLPADFNWEVTEPLWRISIFMFDLIHLYISPLVWKPILLAWAQRYVVSSETVGFGLLFWGFCCPFGELLVIPPHSAWKALFVVSCLVGDSVFKEYNSSSFCVGVWWGEFPFTSSGNGNSLSRKFIPVVSKRVLDVLGFYFSRGCLRVDSFLTWGGWVTLLWVG